MHCSKDACSSNHYCKLKFSRKNQFLLEKNIRNNTTEFECLHKHIFVWLVLCEIGNGTAESLKKRSVICWRWWEKRYRAYFVLDINIFISMIFMISVWDRIPVLYKKTMQAKEIRVLECAQSIDFNALVGVWSTG